MNVMDYICWLFKYHVLFQASVCASIFWWDCHLGLQSLVKTHWLHPTSSHVFAFYPEHVRKHHHGTFLRRIHKKFLNPFDVVHTHIFVILDKMNVHLLYFVVSFDDISIISWLNLLKDPAKLPHIISVLYNEIVNQIDTKINFIVFNIALGYTKSCARTLVKSRSQPLDYLSTYITTKWCCRTQNFMNCWMWLTLWFLPWMFPYNIGAMLFLMPNASLTTCDQSFLIISTLCPDVSYPTLIACFKSVWMYHRSCSKSW